MKYFLNMKDFRKYLAIIFNVKKTRKRKQTAGRRILAKYFLSFSLFSNAALLLQQSELLFLAVNNTEIADNYKNLS